MDWSKMKQEPSYEAATEIAACAHDYVGAMRRFDMAAMNCPFKEENHCTKIASTTMKWECKMLCCPYCSPVFFMYIEETKRSD
jgi:hypothetical protein